MYSIMGIFDNMEKFISDDPDRQVLQLLVLYSLFRCVLQDYDDNWRCYLSFWWCINFGHICIYAYFECIWTKIYLMIQSDDRIYFEWFLVQFYMLMNVLTCSLYLWIDLSDVLFIDVPRILSKCGYMRYNIYHQLNRQSHVLLTSYNMLLYALQCLHMDFSMYLSSWWSIVYLLMWCISDMWYSVYFAILFIIWYFYRK